MVKAQILHSPVSLAVDLVHMTEFYHFPDLILIIQAFHILHVLGNHKRDLKGNGILKYTKVKSGALLQLVQTVNQGISVDIQLSGSLGYIQAVLKELVDRSQGLLVELIR